LVPASASRTASRRNSSLYAFGPRFVMPHLLPRISIEALEVSTKSGELQIPYGLLTQNSNSLVNTLLIRAGLKPLDYDWRTPASTVDLLP
jgi:hypothetical protein